MSAFRQGLKEAGYAEGGNLRIEERWAHNQLDRVPVLADGLIQRRVEVIVTVGGTSVAKAAKATRTTIPIVFVLGSDPVEDGLVASMNRPGANVTGVSFFSNVLIVKRREMLREIAPKATLVAVLVNPRNARAERDTSDMQAGATAVGQQVLFLRAGTPDDLDAACLSLSSAGAGALLVTSDAFFTSRHQQLVVLAARHGVPQSMDSTSSKGRRPDQLWIEHSDSHRQGGIYVGQF